MSLTFSEPSALVLLAALPLVWAAHAAARTNFSRGQRRVQTAVRSLLVASLALALARPVILTSSTRDAVVYLVDVSHSIAGPSLEVAARAIEEIDAALRPAHSRILAFGTEAVPVDDTAVLRRLARPAERTDDTPAAVAVDRGGTDLEAALLAARGELPPDHVPHVVLFSDGRPTAGDTDLAVVRLAAGGVPVSAEPIASRTIADAWVDGLVLPPRAAAGMPFGVTVRVGSYRDGTATVRLQAGDRLLAARDVTLAMGGTEVTLEGTLDVPGVHAVQATLTAAGDPLTGNNTMAGEVWIQPRARVLYVEGTPASAKYLAGALTDAGFEVSVQPPAGLPATVEALEPFDVAILSDVSRAALTDTVMDTLTAWVERGGGLLVAGGEAVYGDRGYRDTALERLMPVTFERRDEPEIALILVLDRSWSMAGASMELTKAAAQAAVDVLSDEQSIGVLTFNDKFDWDVTLRNVGKHREEIRQKIAAIGPGGHTLIYPAVEQAYLALRNARARARHVILLSDGRSYPGDYEGLVKKMVEARITLSTVAVGPSADPDLLRDLAQWGRGRPYVVADASQVPEIFVKEAKNAATPAFDEKPVSPVLKTPGFLRGADFTQMPQLKGRTATVLKDTALELVATDEDDPLLAFWPVGLGRTAVFASDVKDRWAAEWVTWRGYGPFFASVVRALQRQRSPAVALDVVPGPIRGQTRAVAVAVEARDAAGGYRNLQNPVLQVQPAGAAPSTLATRQVAPGRYEATLIADATRPLTIAVAGTHPEGSRTTRTVFPDPAAEYRFGPPDEALLRSIASATGGVWRPTPDSLRDARGDSRTRRRPLWPALLGLALALWFLDLLLRRIRILEPRV